MPLSDSKEPARHGRLKEPCTDRFMTEEGASSGAERAVAIMEESEELNS